MLRVRWLLGTPLPNFLSCVCYGPVTTCRVVTPNCFRTAGSGPQPACLMH